MGDFLFEGDFGGNNSEKKLQKPSKRSGDLLFTGSGKVSNKKETHQTQTYTFTFEANSSKYNAQTIEANGTIQQIDSPVNCTLSKLTSSSPFKEQLQTGDTVSEGDIVEVELDSQPTSQVKVEVVVSYSDITETKITPEESGGRYLYSMIDTEQKVFVIDTDTDSVIKTINIPSSPAGKVSCMTYRDKDSSIYCFGLGRYVQINADAASANFNTIVKDEDLRSQLSGNIGKTNGATYDLQDDLLFFGEIDNRFIVLDPKQNNAFFLQQNQFAGTELFFAQAGATYIHSLRAVAHQANPSFTFLDKNIIINQRFNNIGISRGESFFYSPELGAFYAVSGGLVKVVTVQGVKMTVKAQIERNTAHGVNIYHKETGRLFSFDNRSPKVDIIDLATATRTASGSYQSSPSTVFTLNGAVAGNGFLYVRDGDNAQLYKLDPSAPPSSMKITTIPLNYTPARQKEDTMVTNKLKLL